jgi:hypothetical protein
MAYDEHHWHEALDRTSCVQELVDAILSSHPVIQGDKELATQLAKVEAELCALYQMVGLKTPLEHWKLKGEVK